MTFAAPMESVAPRVPAPWEKRLVLVVFAACLAFNFWGVHVGWQSKNLPGNEFRQAQTALAAYWIKADHDFSLAYPTPVLGKPWSVPMEFPFYQWTVVVVSQLTNWSLTKAGRAVSIACFYLALPAVFLLLRRWQVAPTRRWLVLAVILTCPLYIYFTRAFLIETMALMFSLWFWVAFERAVAERNKAWLALAIVAGSGAGLVKVTTYLLYLLPPAWWAATRLWATRKSTWKIEFAWMTAAVTVPFAATLWWLHFADATKELNVLATWLTSANLRDFNLGTNATRFSIAMWQQKFQIIRHELTWFPGILLCGGLAVLAGRRRWREITASTLWFGSVLVAFPVLYTLHVYYYSANTLLLSLAMGLVLVALAESGVSRWLAYGAAGLVLAGQVGHYLTWYYPGQRLISYGGNGLSTSLRTLTRPRDVIVVLGQDWNSMTPYYSQRRAVMIRDDVARDPARVEKALANLGDETIGALVVQGNLPGERWLIDCAEARGIDPRPMYQWRNTTVYLPHARRAELLNTLLEIPFDEVKLAPGVEVPRAHLAGRWLVYGALRKWEQTAFQAMNPRPARFFARFGPALDGSSGQPMYGAHPVTRLVFSLPAGPHVLRSSLQMKLEAWRLDLPDGDASDGVEVSLFALGPNEQRQQLATRYFDPRHIRDDRGNARPLEFKFNLPAAGDVELFFGPGPNGRDTRDWIELGPLKID